MFSKKLPQKRRFTPQLESLESRQLLAVVGATPVPNTIVSTSPAIEAHYTPHVNASNVVMSVHGSQLGFNPAQPGLNPSTGMTPTIAYPPRYDLQAGEKVQVTVSDGTEDGSMVWEFRTHVGCSSAMFAYDRDFGSQLGNDVVLGHFDNDQQLDMFVATGRTGKPRANRIYLSGSSSLTLTAPDVASEAVLADFNNDGSIDIFVARYGDSDLVMLNDGNGSFTNTIVVGSQALTRDADVGDFDADGDLDIVVANEYGGSRVYENQFNSQLMTLSFDERAQHYNASGTSTGVAVGDLNNDGQLDFVLVGDGPDHVFMGTFVMGVDFKQAPAFGLNQLSLDVELGDLDNDGSLEAIVVGPQGRTIFENNEIWGVTPNLVNGFVHQESVPGAGRDAEIGDLDGNGTLDIVVTHPQSGTTVYENNGGAFAVKHQTPALSGSKWNSVTIGDISGDRRLDIIGARNLFTDVWHNQPCSANQRNSSSNKVDSKQRAHSNTATVIDLSKVKRDDERDAERTIVIMEDDLQQSIFGMGSSTIDLRKASSEATSGKSGIIGLDETEAVDLGAERIIKPNDGETRGIIAHCECEGDLITYSGDGTIDDNGISKVSNYERLMNLEMEELELLARDLGRDKVVIINTDVELVDNQ